MCARGPRQSYTPPDVPAAACLARVCDSIVPALTSSRQVLLGTRPPGDPTCITQQLQGNRIILQGSLEGGPGLGFVAFCVDCPDPPLDLFNWSQKELRSYLEAQRAANSSALVEVESLAAYARELADSLHTGPMPCPQSVPVNHIDTIAWPAQCLAKLEAALHSSDPNTASVWADELVAATFTLVDLHHWLDTLLESHLASLGFQALCKSAFEFAQTGPQPSSDYSQSYLPVSAASVAWGQNYLEIERQAEQAFCATPAMISLATYYDLSGKSAARWMPPEQRGAFLWLRSQLSSDKKQTWDIAAASPFTRSRLAAILHRAALSKTIDAAVLVLKRLDASHSTVTPDELTDALFYRAGFNSSGFDWADRYDSRLLDASAKILGTQDTVIHSAQRAVNGLLEGWQNYEGGVATLRDALDTHKFDCVRGTDLVGALYRNAGYGRFYLGRLNCVLTGHSVGVIPLESGGRSRLLIVDSLDSNPTDQYWPGAYSDGIIWPDGYPGPRAPLYSAELYVPGLNAYVFAEGHVMRGPNAGQRICVPLNHLAPDLQDAASTHDTDSKSDKSPSIRIVSPPNTSAG